MKFHRLTFVLGFVLLTGCAAVNQAQMNAAGNKIGEDIQNNCWFFLSVSPDEAAAWTSAGDGLGNCPDMKALKNKKLSDTELEDGIMCSRKFLEEKISPVTYSKSQFKSYLDARDDALKKYARGKLDDDEYKRAFQKRFDKYFGSARKAGKGSFYNWSQCRRDAFMKYTPQSYPAWPALHEHLAEVSKMARAADKKHMETEDFNVEVEKSWAEFSSKEAQIVQSQKAANAAAWRDWSRGMQQYSSDLLRQQNSSNNSMKNTNCTLIGNTMNCTEW